MSAVSDNKNVSVTDLKGVVTGRRVFLFDVDGTLAESTQKVDGVMVETLVRLSKEPNVILGIVGGGTHDKIKTQLGGAFPLFRWIFCESGSIVYENGILRHQNDLRQHPLFTKINLLKKRALAFIASEDFEVIGHLLDQRSGMVYISLPGIQANLEERNRFLIKDHKKMYRSRLIHLLQKETSTGDIEICAGGAVGIDVHPPEWGKTQVLQYFLPTDRIWYFGDRYRPNENDHRLITHPQVQGIPVDNPKMTIETISKILTNK